MKEKRILLYGMKGKRSAFFDAVVNGEFKWLCDEKPHMDDFRLYIIDNYNEKLNWLIIDHLKELTSPEAWQLFSKKWLTYLPPEYKRLFLWEEYYQSMEQNTRNHLLTIFKEAMKFPVKANYGAIGYKNKENKLVYISGIIKRGCKNGIDMAKDHSHVYIYFILDGMDMQAVLNKQDAKKYNGKYTNRELRFTFRNWGKLKDKVIFIKDNQETAAPWIKGTHVRLWQEYNRQRNLRLFDKLVNEEKLTTETISSGKQKQEKLKSFRSLCSLYKQQARMSNQGVEKVSRERSLSI